MKNVKTNIKATNLELTESIKEHLNQKLEHLEKFLNLKGDREAIIDVELSKTTSNQNQGPIFYAEFNLSYKGALHRAVSTQEDLMTAIDEAENEMKKQLRRGKDKQSSLFRRGAQKVKDIIKFGRTEDN